MTKIGCREIHFIKATQSHQIDFMIERVKEALSTMKIPAGYDVKIYKNVFSCCGIGGLGVIIEADGPEEEELREIDIRAMSKVLEFCEQEGLEIGHHTYGSYETL